MGRPCEVGWVVVEGSLLHLNFYNKADKTELFFIVW